MCRCDTVRGVKNGSPQTVGTPVTKGCVMQVADKRTGVSLRARLVRGNRNHGTRLHDEKGNFVGWSRLARNGPRAAVTGIARLTCGARPLAPWISYDAMNVLRRHITKTSRILEFGSGMSTVWFARHAGAVFSIEDDSEWYQRVRRMLDDLTPRVVHYVLSKCEEEYYMFMTHDATGFDVILIDGSHRSRCVEYSHHLLRPGGILYLDNTDMNFSTSHSDYKGAEDVAVASAHKMKADVEYFTDFAPANFYVSQGMLMRRRTG